MKEQVSPCDSCKPKDKSVEQILACYYYDETSSPCAIKCPCNYQEKNIRDILFCPHFESDPNKENFNEGNPPCAGNYDGEGDVAKALLASTLSTLGKRPSSLDSDTDGLPRIRNGSFRSSQHSGSRHRQE